MKKEQIEILASELDFCPENFINKTIAFYGPPKTGKTVSMRACMELLSKHIPYAIVISPTQGSNGMYTGIVPPQMIYPSLYIPYGNGKPGDAKSAEKFMNDIKQHQEIKTAIYQKVSNMETLHDLVKRLPKSNRDELKQQLMKLDQVIKDKQKKCGANDDLLKKLENIHQTTTLKRYKEAIKAGRDILLKQKICTEFDTEIITYIDINPHLLLVLDDCAAEIKPFLNKPHFRDFFYNGRHLSTTLLISCQDETDLGPNLRKSIHTSVITDPICCSSYFGRTKKALVKSVDALIPKIYVGHQKLIYVRDGEEFFFYTFPKVDVFRFGIESLWELCDEVKAKEGEHNKDNQYYDVFKLS